MADVLLHLTPGAMIGRRPLLRASLLGSAGLAAAALVGCGGEDEAPGGESTSAASTTGDSGPTGPGKLVKDADGHRARRQRLLLRLG
jgi:hypothetical protein